jgi:outer membrane protein assembly factor BamA
MRLNISNAIICVLFLFSSCSSFITSEYILYKQSIKGNKNVPTEELEALYRQRVNRKFYKFMPYASIYEKSRQKREKIRIKDSLTRVEYAQKIAQNPEDKEVLQKELKRKLRKIGDVKFRLEEEMAYYDTLLRKYSRKNNEKKYFKIRKKRDKKIAALELEKEKGNFWMRVVGEPFSIYNPDNTEKTRLEMEKYLFFKGYLSGKVSVEKDSVQLKIGKKPVKTVNVTYRIKEGLPHIIDSIYYVTTNPIIDSLIRNSPTKLKVGQILERAKAEEERNRIESVLLQNGFYRFDKQYVIIQVDTSIQKVENVFTGSGQDTDVQVRTKNLTHIRFVINNPQKKDTAFISKNTIGNAVSQIYLDNILGQHIQYKVKNVSFAILEEGQMYITDSTKVDSYPSNDSLSLRFYQHNYRYSKKILYNKVLITPNSLYRKDLFDKTNQSLAAMNLFKFRSIQTKDNKRGELDVTILATPYDKMSLNNEIGMTVSQNVPGPFFNTSLVLRNLFGGCGVLENNLLFSVDGQASFIDIGNVYRTTQVSFTSSYTVPLLFVPGKLKYKRSVNALNPNTRITASISFVARPEYGRRNFRLAMTYNWFKNTYNFFGFSPIDLNVINTYRLDARFENLLNDFSRQGNNLALSFRNAFITSSSFHYEYNTIDNRKNTKQYYWRPTIELGGTLLNLFNQDALERNKFLGLEYFKFMRFSSEVRYYQPLSDVKANSKMVYRLFAGFALPYGKSEILPYEKFFFSGGNTMRGWIQRRLGPGGFQTPDTLANVEKQGNILLEANAEYRFKLWSFVNMGLFVDVGNIWTLEDRGFKDSGFSSRFYEQLAVATGTGMRLDFSFLLIRFDLGLRVIDPARPANDRFVLNKVRLKNLFGGSNAAILNLGIGYPF